MFFFTLIIDDRGAKDYFITDHDLLNLFFISLKTTIDNTIAEKMFSRGAKDTTIKRQPVVELKSTPLSS
jgi:hypothetical protein